MFVVFAVHVESSTEDSVDFEASLTASADGEDPCVVLGEKGDRCLLHLYSLNEDAHHVKQWSRDLPEHVTADCRKAVTGAGGVLLQERKDNSTTFLVNGHRVLDSWEQEGELIGCLSPRRAVYQLRRKEEDDSQLMLRGKDRSLSTVEQTWRLYERLSVCGYQDKTAVTEGYDQTLLILSAQGDY